MTLKEKLISLLGDQKKNIKKYIVTFSLIVFTTLFMVFAGFENETIGKIYVTLFFTTLLCFYIETILESNLFRIPLYLISIVLAYTTKNIIFDNEHKAILLVGIAGGYIALTLYAIYKIIKDNDITLSQFLTRFLNNNIILGIASTALYSGLLFITSIIVALLLNNSDLDIYLKVIILFLGLFVIPGELLCLLNLKKEVIKLVRALIKNIILPLVLIAGAVIYIYFIKILLKWEIPSNQIFLIISALYLFACPTWIMINSFKEDNKFINKCSKLIPYLFIPFILMQIYSMGIRIISYGLTPMRYLGMMLVIFEIITVILSVIKEQKYLNKAILFLIGITIILTIIPRINIIDAPWYNQLSRLTAIYKENTDYDTLSKDKKAIVEDAYKYLYYNRNSSNHELPEYINNLKDEIKNITDIYEEESSIYNYRNTKYLNYDSQDTVSVEGYSKFKEVSYNYYSYSTPSNIYNIKFETLTIFNETDKNINIRNKLREFFIQALEMGEINNGTIVLDNDTAIVFKEIDCNYYLNTNEINSLTLTAYLLMI